MRQLIVIAHNLRSAHNVGSLLRTAEGLGVNRVYLTGYSPYPLKPDCDQHRQRFDNNGLPSDKRLPHEAAKVHRQIQKTALNAQDSVAWQYSENVINVLAELKKQGYALAAVEQIADSIKLPGFAPPDKLALVVGREVDGIEPEVLAACEYVLEIPMFGHKESFNVVQAAAMALYHCRFS